MPLRRLLLIFIPAVLFAGLIFFYRTSQILSTDPSKQKKESAEEQSLNYIPIFPEDPIIGRKEAPITIIAFEDFGCEHCKALDETFHAFLETHPTQVKIVWKGLPVTRFPYPSDLAHRYAYCAEQQGQFDAFKTYAFANAANLSETTLSTIEGQLKINNDRFQTCLDSGHADAYTNKNKEIAQVFGIQSVPALFLNNQQITVPANASMWEQLLLAGEKN